jgi:superoxide dismutase, Cu-Zn family
MKSLTTLFVAGLTLAAASVPGMAETATARADFKNPPGATVGHAILRETAKGVQIQLVLQNLLVGKHAFHIHETGSCVGPDFESAGGHFNPTGKQHGLENPAGAHAGDMSNIEISSDGSLETEILNARVTLKEGKDNSLLRAGGTALVVHALPDDNKTDPSGEAGPPIACGVITRAP